MPPVSSAVALCSVLDAFRTHRQSYQVSTEDCRCNSYLDPHRASLTHLVRRVLKASWGNHDTMCDVVDTFILVEETPRARSVLGSGCVRNYPRCHVIFVLACSAIPIRNLADSDIPSGKVARLSWWGPYILSPDSLGITVYPKVAGGTERTQVFRSRRPATCPEPSRVVNLARGGHSSGACALLLMPSCPGGREMRGGLIISHLYRDRGRRDVR
ncbi:hypothetical protein C8Q80DRAFT_59383 [Daedaleopsis nitida]|nr:hypothetical protein C8Q80DRAFT_59383 [Daedaleopsis nitida]